MSKNRIIVTSVAIEGRTKAAAAHDYGVAYGWVHTLVTHYLTGGWDTIEPQSRRSTTSPTRISADLEAEIIQLRHELTTAATTPTPTPSPHVR